MPIEGLSSWTASIGISASLNFCLACTRQALINTGLKSPLALYQRCGERLGQLADQFLQTRNIFRIKARRNRAVEVKHSQYPLVMDDRPHDFRTRCGPQGDMARKGPQPRNECAHAR